MISPGADYPSGDSSAIFTVFGRIFAAISENAPSGLITPKCDPESYDLDGAALPARERDGLGAG